MRGFLLIRFEVPVQGQALSAHFTGVRSQYFYLRVCYPSLRTASDQVGTPRNEFGPFRKRCMADDLDNDYCGVW